MTNPLLPAPARTAGRVLIWALLALLLVSVACAIWLGVRGYLAYGHLRSAETAARAVSSDLGDPAATTARIHGIADDTAAARALTSDPVWQAAQTLPWIGGQLHAVATVTGAVDDVADGALGPLVGLAADFSVDALRPVDGRFDLSGFADMHAAAAASAPDLAAAAASVDGIDRAGLIAPLAAQVDSVAGLLDTVRDSADAVTRATELMPAMLGADGARDYLVVFQNNAEWRSLGGIVGAMAVVHAEDGAISLVAQESGSDSTKYADPVLDIGADLVAIYGTRPARFIQNATQVPSFPLGARVAQEMWARETGTRVDGVIALDPVTLSYVLSATGPITLPTGDVLSSENALSLLLNEVYERYEQPADQDAFFQAAAAAVFDALARGAADPGKLVSAFARAGEEHRLLIWNEDPAEQSVLDGTTLQGNLPETDAAQTAFGVYLNDGTGSKMDYYMHVDSGVGWCADASGTYDAALTVTLRADGPADAASLPDYITGGGSFGVAPGVTRTVAYLYLPAGSEVISSTSAGAGASSGFGSGTDTGRPVLIWSTDLAPGEEANATIRVRTPKTETLTAEVTPVLPGQHGDIAAVCAG